MCVRTALESFVRPAVGVAGASSAGVRESKRRARDAELRQAVLGALKEGGSVLVPVEATGRVLELLVHREQVRGGRGGGGGRGGAERDVEGGETGYWREEIERAKERSGKKKGERECMSEIVREGIRYHYACAFRTLVHAHRWLHLCSRAVTGQRGGGGGDWVWGPDKKRSWQGFCMLGLWPTASLLACKSMH